MKIRKSLLSVAIGAAALFTACTPSTPTSYTITGILPDSSMNGREVVISSTTGQCIIATTTVNGDKFVCEGVADSAMLAILCIKESSNLALMILENGNIEVDFTSEKNGRTKFASGTENNRIIAEVNAKLDSITPEDIKEEGLKLLAEHNNDIIGVYLFMSPYYRLLDDETRLATIEGFGEYLKNIEIVKDEENTLKGKIATAIGKPFADIEGKDAEGNPVKLSDYVGKGNYVLVDMWASWCGPCKAEIPNIAELHNLYKDKGLTVLGIFVWDEVKNLEPTLKAKNVTWAQIVDTEKKATLTYGVNGIPEIMLIGPDGTILERGSSMRGANMKNTIEKYLLKK